MIVLLQAKHKKETFACGKEPLDNYLHKQASQDIKKKVAVCYVLPDEDGRVAGYYTLSNAGIERDLVPEQLQKKLPRYKDLPVTLLGRLAVDQHHAGKGYGSILLIDALRRCLEISAVIGSMAVVVDPIDEGAKQFYLKHEFIPLDSGKMFIAMDTIAAMDIF
jgi:GNAT superfamily N-acetyltransferase